MSGIKDFDEHTEAYDVWFDEHYAIYQAELEAVRGFIPAKGKGLEVGVGTGRFAAPLGISLGVEPSPAMAAMAEKRGVEVVVATAEVLPFGDEVFDFVLMITVICFVDHPVLAIQEARRVLKPGGSLIIGYVDRDSELGRQYFQKKEKSRFYKEAVFYTPLELEGMLSSAGFSGFKYRQALFPNEDENKKITSGYGQGSFVVLQSIKKREDL